MDLKEEALLGPGVGRHWYYRAKAQALLRVVEPAGAAVLDVGAGSGFFARRLLEAGASEATLVDPGYPADRNEIHAGKPLRFRRYASADGATLILMMDVLEHVDDDIGLARDYLASARPGTRLAVTVPAFQWLWSGHDVFLEHKRR
ncbi:MAG: methyltransferase domain-containing protein, partial [Phenylobacterium sp.]